MRRNAKSSDTAELWMAVCLLFAAALVTASLVVSMLVPAIEDTGEGIEIESEGEPHVVFRSGSDEDNIISSGNAEEYARNHPEVLVKDENGVIWTSKSRRIEIFHLRYLSPDKYEITVETSDKDKIIAPGTGNDYDFEIRNTGNANLHYKLFIETSTDPSDLAVPVEGRLVSGSRVIEDWLSFENLDGVTDSGTLSSRNSISYTFEWEWPFGEQWKDTDGGSLQQGLENTTVEDLYDTMIGNMAVDQDLIVRVDLKVVAWYDDPDTGDSRNLILWTGVFVAALCILSGVGLLVHRRRREEDESSEQQ